MPIADRFPGALVAGVPTLSSAHAQAQEAPTQQPRGVKLVESAAMVAKAGCGNVYLYRNGRPDWKARKLPLE